MMGDLVLFGGCTGGIFNFELADFGTEDSFNAGVSHVSEKFDMVVGNLKTSSLAGGEPAGTARLCQLVDTRDVKLPDVTSCNNCSRNMIGTNESS